MESKEQVVGHRDVVTLDGRRTSVSIIYALLMLAAATSPAFAQRGRIERGEITSAGLTNNLFGDNGTRPYAVYLPPSDGTTQSDIP